MAAFRDIIDGEIVGSFDSLQVELMKRIIAGFSTIVVLIGLGAQSAGATVIATFSDPNTTAFSFANIGTNNDGVGDLTANNSGLSLDMSASFGVTFPSTSFSLTDQSSVHGPLTTITQTDVGGVVFATFEAGILTFTTDQAANGLAAGDTIMTATFDRAIGVFGNVSSSDDLPGNNVIFWFNPVLTGQTAVAESFSFSAANLLPGSAVLAPADMEDWTATVAFTSSATLVPEPLSLLLVGSSLVGLVVLRRRV